MMVMPMMDMRGLLNTQQAPAPAGQQPIGSMLDAAPPPQLSDAQKLEIQRQRTIERLRRELSPYEENPALLDRMIREYMQRNGLDPAE